MRANRPSIEATHDFMMQAVREFSLPYSISEEHVIESELFQPTPRVDQPHTFEAKLVIPHRLNRSGEDSRRVGKRLLTLSLLGEETLEGAVSRSVGSEYPVSSIWHPDSGIEIPYLARLSFHFDTKKVHDVDTELFADGDHANINPNDVEDILRKYFGETTKSKAVAPLSVAREVEDFSLVTNNSVIRSYETLNIAWWAREINRLSGMPIPKSLQGDLPSATVARSTEMTFEYDDPFFEGTNITIDTWHNDPPARLFTNYEAVQFNNYTNLPSDEEPFAQFSRTVHDEDGNKENQTIWVDASKRVRGNIEKPHDKDELREMLQPFIRAVTNLRRYDDKAANSF